MSFLGVDLGTSFIKGSVLDLEALQLQHVLRVPFPDPLANEDPRYCEFHPGVAVDAVRGLIDELARHAPDCEGLVMCSQMHGLVLMNERGDAESPFLSWRDQRAMMPILRVTELTTT